MFVEYPLGNEAREYVAARLADGKTLSQHVSRHLDEFTCFYTFLPEGRSREDVTDFDAGGKLSVRGTSSAEPIRNTDGIAVGVIHAHLERAPQHVCVLENALFLKHDVAVRNMGNVMFCEEEVYHLLSPQDSREALGRLLRSAMSIPQFVGVLSTNPGGSLLGTQTEIGSDVLRRLAGAASAVLVGAYDGEGYVFAARRA
jgi:hypothetical protein